MKIKAPAIRRYEPTSTCHLDEKYAFRAIRSIALTCSAFEALAGSLSNCSLTDTNTGLSRGFMVLSWTRLKIIVRATMRVKPPAIWLTTLRLLISLSVKLSFIIIIYFNWNFNRYFNRTKLETFSTTVALALMWFIAGSSASDRERHHPETQ